MSPDKRVDVELKCSGCRREKLATDGCWSAHCYCGGTFEVTVRHDHVLTWKESQALGYSIQPAVL